MVAVNSLVSIMTYSRVYVGVIMSAADELFLVRIHPACCRFTMGKLFYFSRVLYLSCCVLFSTGSLNRLLDTLEMYRFA